MRIEHHISSLQSILYIDFITRASLLHLISSYYFFLLIVILLWTITSNSKCFAFLWKAIAAMETHEQIPLEPGL